MIGSEKSLFVSNKAIVNFCCVFDTRQGPIVIDDFTEITPFSYLTGPLYVGKNCKVDNVKIGGGTIIGNNVRVGGEIESSIISDFSNKHHEGFLGHSLVGSWVNLGALSTTSDLKNNYGEIRLNFANSFYPSKKDELYVANTNQIKFGSIIGDCSKIGIGVMINTGTVIDAGCNIWGRTPDKYNYPFSWGKDETYEINKFFEDASKIFARRQQLPHVNLKLLANSLVKNLK